MIDKTQENWNKFSKLLDQLEYLEDEEEVSERALGRAKNKLKSVSEILDSRHAERKLKEAEKLLDAQERIIQSSI